MPSPLRFISLTRSLSVLIALAAVSLQSGCVQVRTEPIRIEPIYIEITINHRVQKELDDLFGDIDRASKTADFIPIEPSKNP